MKKSRLRTSITREDLLKLFQEIDAQLVAGQQRVTVTVLGGASIIMLGFRDRATLDIDIAGNRDAVLFRKICAERGISVDIITIVSTVDFNDAPTVELYRGAGLTVRSVTADDLVKLKLERFRKQDPEDIYAIIEKTQMDFEKFLFLVKEMLPDFIGNPQELTLSARLVVERMYPGRLGEFRP